MHTPDEGSSHSSAKRNTLGLAALVLAGLAILIQGVSIALLVVLSLSGGGHGEHDERSYGLMFCAGGLLTFPGLGLGIAGLFPTGRRRGMALAAVALNATSLLLALAMLALGVSEGS